MCCLTPKQNEVLNILKCASHGLTNSEIYYRTGYRFNYKYEVQEALNALKYYGYVTSYCGVYYASCCAPSYCCPPCGPSVVVVEKTVYVPVIATPIPPLVSLPPKKSYGAYLIECQYRYVIPMTEAEYNKS